MLGLAAALLPAGRAAAQDVITFTAAAANWHDAVDNVPGSQPGDPVITNGVPTSSISWGTTTGSQSGYDVSIEILDPLTFPVATFAHRNFPVSDPSLISVQLDFVLDFEVNGAQTGPLTFTFTFTHEETPNNLTPCPYPTPPGEGCTDRVTFIDAPDPTTFTVGGKTYTLGLSFLDQNGDPVAEFITREGGLVNTANLDADFTLVPPVLEVTKSGPATLTVGQLGVFTIDARNTGPNDAWNTTLRDVLPDGATGGMCDATPEVLGAQVFAADGVTPVPGKGALVAGTDFTVSWAGAPSCALSLAMLTPAAAIDTDQRLIVSYRTQLDADSQDGVALTNVAGAVEWFDDESTNPDRVTFTRTLTDGSAATVDHEDAHTVTVRLRDYLFEKTVANLTTGVNPALEASPGDRLRYRIRIENRDTSPLDEISLLDEIDRLNAVPVFAPGTLTVVTVPAGADATNTNPIGGASGTGVLDVRNLSVAPGTAALIELEVVLAPVIANGAYVANQSQLLVLGAPFGPSDDPNVNGPADPFVVGDEDPTRVQIVSAPIFRVQKRSADLTGDPAILLAGETLRYTITVQNVGSDDASDASLRDAVPANTAYVPGSTSLNGTPVPDGPGGSSPLAAGIAIYAPENPTPGALRADGSPTATNIATIAFDVVVDAAAVNGTILSNQGFVSAPGGGVVGQPSDDPDTAAPDDPTRDAVGGSPLIFAPKSAALLVDGGTAGVVDPGDVLRYTITVYNNGGVPATGVVLRDTVPANTTYVADSTTLNGVAVGQPDGGVSPLVAGVAVGTIGFGESAALQLELRVNAGVAAGTIIRNQAIVESVELPDVLTDGDGDPSTGPEPTEVVVGNAQQLTITKQVAVVGGGAALGGSTLEYVVRVVNISALPASLVVIRDDLEASTPGTLSYVAGSATLNGSAVGVTVVGSLITADYAATFGVLAPNASIALRFRALINPSLAMGAVITNTGTVYWNDPTQTASASVSIAVGGMPGIGVLNGAAWHDANFDRVQDGGERAHAGWLVDLYRNGATVQTAVIDAAGVYRIAGVAPNATTADTYELRFRAPDAGALTASLGIADSVYTNGPQRISDIVVPSGGNLQNLNLPITPNGVVYGAIDRGPVGGAALRMVDAGGGAALPSVCFDDPLQQGQVTRADGFYKFDLNFTDPSCPSGGSYRIEVAAPGGAFGTGYSQLIPPIYGPSTAPLPVPTCPGGPDDALPFTLDYCEATPSELAPPPSVRARTPGTNYSVHLLFDASRPPGSAQIYNNHIPVDPVLDGLLGITKTTPSLNVTRGQLVPYEITLNNALGAELPDLALVDRFPAGFRYVEGSARIDGVPTEPTANGSELLWSNLTVPASGRLSVQLLLAVSAGVTEGEFVNRAQALSQLTGTPLSGEAAATVRVIPDTTFDCTDVIGKVFADTNRNGEQDAEEPGLHGVRVVTVRGLAARTDQYGRFHITCAVTPREGRGSNFVLKLDDRTLPSGFRMSTDPVQVQRATRGKALKYSFGASIHRVVGLDMADDVFEPGSIEMRPQWQPRIDKLVEELRKAPSTLRLSYVADVEDEALVDRRLKAIKQQINDAWQARDPAYRLTIEPEVFWRRGAPPEPGDVRTPEDR